MQNKATALLGGILPFGAAFVELYFVLSSLFASRAYYAFGFLALTAGVVGLTTATVTILFTYFLLCAEEYRWVSFSLTVLSLLLTHLSLDGTGAPSLLAVEVHSGCLLTGYSTGCHAFLSTRSLALSCT